MCNGTEGKKTAVWGWWGALGNLATAPLEETPHTPGTTWQHKPIRVPASALFFYQGTEKIKLYSVSQMQDHRTEVRRKKNHFIVMVVLAAFIKYTQNCQSISKRSALVAKQFFSRCFFFQWYGEPLINRTLPFVPKDCQYRVLNNKCVQVFVECFP